MKVAIPGAGGLVASALLRRLPDAVPLRHADLDVTDGAAVSRALRGIDFRAFDVVEVAPQYDGPGQITALLAANVAYEMLSLIALARG